MRNRIQGFNINMNFTTTPPTTPGFYAWRHIAGNQPTQAFHVTEWLGELYGSGCCRPVTQMGGEWCRLVPAEEVKEAFEEGWGLRSGVTGGLPKIPWMESNYELSRAKQVAEGKL